MKRCSACDSRAYLADVHCQRCGTAIVPPPPLWLQRVGAAFRALVLLTIPVEIFQGLRFALTTERGRHVLAALAPAWRFLLANGADIASLLGACVVAPLIAFYFAFKAMIDVGDLIDWMVQQWRAERFRKFGW